MIEKKLMVLCPFHKELTPSCWFEPANDHYKCFGCGAEGKISDHPDLLTKFALPKVEEPEELDETPAGLRKAIIANMQDELKDFQKEAQAYDKSVPLDEVEYYIRRLTKLCKRLA